MEMWVAVAQGGVRPCAVLRDCMRVAIEICLVYLYMHLPLKGSPIISPSSVNQYTTAAAMSCIKGMVGLLGIYAHAAIYPQPVFS